jgi:protoheme IX farnesyltransferase
MYHADYARGGIRMLPAIEPDCRSTARQMILYGAALIPVSVLPYAMGIAGPLYASGAIALGGAYLLSSVRAARRRSTASLRGVLFASVIYLPLLYSLILVDALRAG